MIKKLLFACSLIVCFLCLYSIPVSADTDGTELQVMEASMLEIQLGTEWKGVEFQLKTDVGLYPDKILVGEDGVLRLEIGGSSVYTLTCLDSDVEIPDSAEEPEKLITPGEEGTNQDSQTNPGQTGETQEEHNVQEQNPGTVAGIPIPHLVIFCGGLLIASSILIAIRIVSRKRDISSEYGEEEDYDDE